MTIDQWEDARQGAAEFMAERATERARATVLRSLLRLLRRQRPDVARDELRQCVKADMTDAAIAEFVTDLPRMSDEHAAQDLAHMVDWPSLDEDVHDAMRAEVDQW
jgi:hypothetical protein